MVLDEAADEGIWEMLAEAKASDAVHRVQLRAHDTPAARIEALLTEMPRMSRPLGRAAAGFMQALREYEEPTDGKGKGKGKGEHPLLTAAMRKGGA